MQITYYGHSCFSVQLGGKIILFDPFIRYNELAKHINISTLHPDYILLSHGHEDHIADAITIAQQTGCKVVASWEIVRWLNLQGIQNTHPMNTGGKWNFDFGTVKCVVAHHSSGLPDGSYGGNPMGFVITAAEGNLYYSGDTALTLDMQLIPKWANLQVAILPIGDNFTMDVADAIEASNFVQCATVLGVHYDTFGFIKVNKEEAIEAFANAGKTLLLPAIGQTISI